MVVAVQSIDRKNKIATEAAPTSTEIYFAHLPAIIVVVPGLPVTRIIANAPTHGTR